MPVWVRVQGGEQFRDLSRKLKAQGRGDLQRKLRKQVRDAGRPVIADLRGAVLAVNVQSDRGGAVRPDRSTGLRSRVASALTISITQRGIRIKVDEKRVGPFGVTLPRYLDGELRKYQNWRHPVFGNRNVWAVQHGRPWFFTTIRGHRADFRRAVFQAMRDTADEIT